MKRIFYTVLLVGSFVTGVLAQTVTELVVPQYMASKTASGTNNARMYFPVCLRIDGLAASTTYSIRVSMGLTTDAATSFGAGNIWGTSSFGSVNPTFTTDATGSTGPIWFYLQPTGNGTRFGGGTVHNLRVGWAISPASVPSTPSYISTATITSLDVANTALTVGTTDDGAFLQGNATTVASGRIVLLYDNTAGTGNPLSTFRIRNHQFNQNSQTELPAAIDSILKPGTNVAQGDYAMVIPIGANNPNGVRRIEVRDTLNNFITANTDADGIWPSGANTTTVLRRNVVNINSTDAPLPVQWRSFTASQTPSGNQLRWSTATEVNNNQFEVQRSNNGRTFETIGVVKGKGNSQKVTNYAFTDEVVSKGTVFYRLKQIDFDGKFEYSKTVSITVATPTSGISQLSPNPFSNEMNVTIKAASSGTASVVVMDMVGKVHHSFTSEVNSGAQTIRFETADMPDGIYFVRATINGETFTQKIIKK